MLVVQIKQEITVLLILTTYITASCLFTFVWQGMFHVEFNSVVLFTILYSLFCNYAEDMSMVTVQPSILESEILKQCPINYNAWTFSISKYFSYPYN